MRRKLSRLCRPPPAPPAAAPALAAGSAHGLPPADHSTCLNPHSTRPNAAFACRGQAGGSWPSKGASSDQQGQPVGPDRSPRPLPGFPAAGCGRALARLILCIRCARAAGISRSPAMLRAASVRPACFRSQFGGRALLPGARAEGRGAELGGGRPGRRPPSGQRPQPPNGQETRKPLCGQKPPGPARSRLGMLPQAPRRAVFRRCVPVKL